MTDKGSPPQRNADLPLPQLRLRRVYLLGVGPDGARFDPLDLDFTSADGAASRVLLSLTNTGGKSTLITLLSSLVVPASRAQVAGKNLGDYVLTGDTAHIVCEWEDSRASMRTVTAAVMEWKDGRRQPAHKQRSTTNMHRAWYLFRTGPGLPGVEELPFLIDGRRATFERYLSAATHLLAQSPRSQWVLARTQQDWARALEDRTSIDPVLFGYQMRMNDAEAGAEKLLATFDSPDNVVRFFVSALNDERAMADFTAKLAPYAELAAQRPQLEAVAGFGSEIAPLVESVASLAESVETASAAATRSRTAGGQHAAELKNRVERDHATLGDLKAAVSAAAKEVLAARREYGQVSDIRLQLQLEQARARLAESEQQMATAGEHAQASAQEADAWQAVDAVLDVQAAATAVESARVAYETANTGLQPLRTRKTQAGAALAGRLEALIRAATADAGAADDATRRSESAGSTAAEAERAADRRLQQLLGALKPIDDQVRQAESAIAAAMADGWLDPGEEPNQCAIRWRASAESAEELADAEAEASAAAEQAFDAAQGDIAKIDHSLVELRRGAGQDADRLAAFDRDFSEVAGNEMVHGLLGQPPTRADELKRVTELAERAAADADFRAARHERLATAAREELAHLDETGTAPTGADVLRVLNVLVEDRIGAVSGLEWIEKNIPDADERPRVITARPDIAGGVLVSDPRRFSDAIELLSNVDLHLRIPVTVTTAVNVGTVHDNSGRHPQHVVLPHRATWDRAWAATARAELDDTVKHEGHAAANARTAAAAYRIAASLCATIAARWDRQTHDGLAQRATASTAALATVEATRGRRTAERDRHRQTAEEARRRREGMLLDAATAKRLLALATPLAEAVEAAAREADRRPTIERDIAGVRQEVQYAKSAQEQARADYKAAVEAAAQARSSAGAFERERNALPVEHSGADPGGNLEVVRETWTTLRDELAAAEQGLVEAEYLNREQRRLSEAVKRQSRFTAAVIERAGQLANSTAASSRESLVGSQGRARSEAAAAEKDRLRAENVHDLAAAALRNAEPADRQNYFDLSNTPQWLAATPADIPGVLQRLDQRNAELRERREAVEQAEREAHELLRIVDSDISTFNDIVGLWAADPVPTSTAFSGSTASARDLMRGHVTTHREAERVERRARDELHTAVVRARAIATEARWRELDAPAAVRMRSLPESDLVAEAAILARRLRSMAESAAGDLSTMDTHRAILRDGLVALCKDQRRLLHEITRASRLPDGLGDLTGQSAVKIRFEEAPEDESAARLAQRVDGWAIELAANPKKATSAELRARWLADAVRDTVVDRTRAGAWSIEILKPRIDGKVVFCPPDRIPHEFSGGQVLTLAVLVYCALSGVRSAHRPGGARPPGTLMLDNPFGAASAEALIEMQYRLAAHTGLQLVCATGLHDPGVEAAFSGTGSVIVKLRNDGDLRRNLSFLRLRSRIVDGIDIAAAITAGRDTASPQNWVDAIRYEIRQ